MSSQHERYEQCHHCKGWVNIERRHCTGFVDGVKRTFHSDFCIDFTPLEVTKVEHVNWNQRNVVH